PNVVHIYDIGETKGIPYFALEYIEGGSLGDRLRGDPQPLAPTVRLVETIARTIHCAHEHGIVHRDLKPANILLSRSVGGEPSPPSRQLESAEDNTTSATATTVAAAERLPSDFSNPKITDFGLAKRIDEPSTRTRSGDIVGTPSYMAPEQAVSDAHEVGP